VRILQAQILSVMVGTGRADTSGAMAALIRLLAIALSAVVALSFVLFAIDEIDRGSKVQQRAVDEGTGKSVNIAIDPAPSAKQESLREQQHSKIREGIDDADDVLLQPFSGLIDSDSNWVTRGVPTLLGLLVYGLGLGLLANFVPRPKRASADWRAA
jgi:hypothetical protein